MRNRVELAPLLLDAVDQSGVCSLHMRRLPSLGVAFARARGLRLLPVAEEPCIDRHAVKIGRYAPFVKRG